MWQVLDKWRRAIAFGLTAFAAAAIVVLLMWPQVADAQTSPLDLLRALQQGQSGGAVTTPAEAPTVQTFQPVTAQGQAPTSVLEQLYSSRAGRPLQQVGYDALGVPATVSVLRSGAAQDSYVLGIGDVLQFDLRGQENSSYRQVIDASGRIILPRLNPIAAAGRTFAEFRAALEQEVSRAYVSTKIFVALGDVHQVSVLVTGEVRTPGARILSALSSPLDAILLSGGISKTGSLRRIELIRGGSAINIDLYSVLLKGGFLRLGMLQDGDRIFVPRLGSTVAISGGVSRPGIYELAPGTSVTTASALIALAGGPIIANSYNLSKTALERDGTTRLVPIQNGTIVRTGEVMFVDPSRAASEDRVVLSGAVNLPGTRPLALSRTTNDLFHGVDELLPGAYGPFALIVRRDRATAATTLIPFSIIRALSGTGGTRLQSGDTVFVFQTSDLVALTRVATKDVNTPYLATLSNGSNPSNASSGAPGSSASTNAAMAPIGLSAGANSDRTAAGTAPGAAAAATTLSGTNLGGIANTVLLDPRFRQGLGNSSASNALAEAQSLINSESGTAASAPETAVAAETDDQTVLRIANQIGVPRSMLLNEVSDRLVWVLDQVHVPGVYAAAEGTSLPEIIQAAGGTLAQADLSSIEVTSTDFDRIAGVSRTTRNAYAANDVGFQSISIRPLDIIRLRKVYADRTGETVTIAGQVRYPGIFDITRDERLSSVLQRAGGLTEVAYPYGAIFTRRSAAIAEAEGNERTAREMQSQLALVMTTPSTGGNAGASEGAVAFIAGLINDIRTEPTLGRISVTADPVVLASRPELDVVMEPGDALYVPKRPSSVTVAGEVLNPGAFQFRANLSFDDYVRMAGGASQSANEGDTFIVLPDGTAVPTSENWLSFGDGGHIPPGSTIVVPRDLRPFDWGVFLRDATQVISQLAVSAASLSVITRANNN